MTSSRLENSSEIQTAPVTFLDGPADYPRIPRSASSMVVPLPDRLRVALHRDAVGVYDILTDAEHPQEKLWMIAEYERVGEPYDGRYRLVRERPLHSRRCWDEAFMFHAETGGDRGCTCGVAAGIENGVPYDALCEECGQRVERRFGAWMCPTHRDQGHVEFHARTDGSSLDA